MQEPASEMYKPVSMYSTQNSPADSDLPIPHPYPQLPLQGDREGGGRTKPARAFQTGTLTLLPSYKWPTYTRALCMYNIYFSQHRLERSVTTKLQA